MAKSSFMSLALVAALVATASAHGGYGYTAPSYGKYCGRTCKYTFCGYGKGREHKHGHFYIDPYHNDAPFTPAICDKKNRFVIGSVDSTGEPLIVVDDGSSVPISSYHPNGLKQSFSRSVFKSYFFPHVHRSGVGHEVFQQNQIDFLNDRCIILPLTAYQILDHYGNVQEEVHPSRSPRYECVAFVTHVSKYRR